MVYLKFYLKFQNLKKNMLNISIIIPCYNEEYRLPSTLKKIESWLKTQDLFKIELILSNDGSNDNTIEIMKSAKIKFENNNLCEVKVLDFVHKGYIATLFESYKKSLNEIVCNMEADCSIHPRNFEIFSRYLGEYDMIQGSRILKSSEFKSDNKSLIRSFVSIFFSFLFRFIFGCKIYDPQCGFKMIKKQKLITCLNNIKLQHDGMKISELTLKFYKRKYPIKEIPVENFHDDDSRLVPKFSLLNPFPFFKVILLNLKALVSLYKLYKQENFWWIMP